MAKTSKVKKKVVKAKNKTANKNKVKTESKKTSSKLQEVETYYPLQVWLENHIKQNHNSDSLVFDSSTTNLNNIDFEGVDEIIEEFDDFDIAMPMGSIKAM